MLFIECLILAGYHAKCIIYIILFNSANSPKKYFIFIYLYILIYSDAECCFIYSMLEKIWPLDFSLSRSCNIVTIDLKSRIMLWIERF